MATDTTDPAFPAPESSISVYGNPDAYTGLTKREMASMHFMAAMILTEDFPTSAIRAFRAADAWLLENAK